MKKSISFLFSLLILTLHASAEEAGKHLFILSGQSNMARHKPAAAFTPAVIKEFGKDNVIVVQDAKGGEPLYRWDKSWKSEKGEKPKQSGDLYDRLMGKVNKAINGQKIQTVTFFWMQGERDAKMQWGSLYEAGFKSLIKQLETDLGRKDVNVVIGRLSDFGITNKGFKDWNKVRDIQVKLAKDNSRGAWVDTDDLNDGVNDGGKKIKNDIHYSAEGYKTLGKRFAAKAIELIKKPK